MYRHVLVKVFFLTRTMYVDREEGDPEEEGPSKVVALKLKASHGTILDATEIAFDPVGTPAWSDDELLGDGGNVRGDEAEVISKQGSVGASIECRFRVQVPCVAQPSSEGELERCRSQCLYS